MADATPTPHPQTDVAASDIVSSGGFGDGTSRLCMALYGRREEVGDWIGGSEARMLHDAAKVIEAARCIRHWHDTHNGGMIVSGEHVRALWASFPNTKISDA